MTQDQNQPIVVNLPEGQNTLTLLGGQAPKQLDQQAPVRMDASGIIGAPLEFLKIRVADIDQHRAHILVSRDNLTITLVYNEDDAYTKGTVTGTLRLSKVFQQFGINADKQWEPEQLGQFLKLNRTYFVSREENMKVVNALKTFDAKVNQTVQRETKENGNKAFTFRQAVDSNIPESFKLRLPVLSGGQPVEIDVETYATIDGAHVSVALQSPGANDIVEDIRQNYITDMVNQLRDVAPEIVIIEQ
ncbi:MAG: DUF2303 family protein [Prevotella sp.]|nr:DUF2303 family protein [Prevotella sp.]